VNSGFEGRVHASNFSCVKLSMRQTKCKLWVQIMSSGAGCSNAGYPRPVIKQFIIFILKSMVFPAIWLVHRSAISAQIALLEVRFVLKSHLLSINHIRVLTSANQSYLIIGFKQPMNFKRNVIWQMSKGPEGGSQSHFPPEILAKSQSQLDFY
jgi:hypothetical protein